MHRGTWRASSIALAVSALTLVGFAPPAQATYAGTNGRIAFGRFTPGVPGFPLYTANPDGTNLMQVFPGPSYCSEWSPNGSRLAFTIADAGVGLIATMDPDGSNLDILGPGECASWSPDQTQLVFDYGPGDPNDPTFSTSLWLMNSDGTGRHPLIPAADGGFDVEPRWSPAGSQITFLRIRKFTQGVQQEAVFVVAADGTGARQVTSNGLAPEHPTWSPDGRWIVFNDASFKPGAQETIWLMRADGTDRQVLYQGTQHTGGVKPQFSPDGTQILFTCVTYGSAFGAGHTEDLCTMDADGTHVVDITHTLDAFENWPSWGTAPVS
jgi:Tol biopolymer transport system component